MRNLEKIIDGYLSKSTDYAIQIAGNWGSGKTYYYRNTLEKLIENKPTYGDASKTYKPIYISLFGLKSIEEIATQIVSDFYHEKLFKRYSKGNKKLKITQGVFKIGLRGFLNFTKLGNLNDYLTDIKDIGRNVLATDELVICFDDLERRNPTLKVEELAGYINSLVDENIKVLLISNEDLLLKGGGEYKNLKEKIIGITVEFTPESKSTLISLIEGRYKSFGIYYKYLNDNIEFLINFSNSCNNNFRHIIYALDCLQNCYSIIKKDIIDVKNNISEHVEKQFLNISLITLALSVEFKSSELKATDLNEYSKILNSDDIFVLNRQSKGKEQERAKLKYEKLMEKYQINKVDYHIYNSIYYYVTGFEEFNSDLFIKEFEKKFHLEEGNILPQYSLLNSLSYSNYPKLSDELYEQKTLELIEYAKKGEFAAADYLSVMHYAERLNNILNLNLEDVCNSLIDGFRNFITKIGSKEGLDFHQFEASGESDGISDYNKKLYKAGLEELTLFKEKIINDKIESSIGLLVNNPDLFIQQYRSDNSFRYHFQYSPFLNVLTPETFLTYVRSFNNETFPILKLLFKDKYKDVENLKKEFENLNQFLSLLTNYSLELTKEKGNKIRNSIVGEFSDSLREIINNGRSLIMH